MMSWINTTTDIGSFLGSWLLKEYNITPHQFMGLDKLVVLRTLCLLIPLFALALLPKEQATTDELEALLTDDGAKNEEKQALLQDTRVEKDAQD